MTFTQDFIDIAINDHKKWIQKVEYAVEHAAFPIAWKSSLLSRDTELDNLLSHLRNEVFEHEKSVYTEIKYELEYTREKIQKMFASVVSICVLIELLHKKLFDKPTQDSLKAAISAIAQDVFITSEDIINRLIRWREL